MVRLPSSISDFCERFTVFLYVLSLCCLFVHTTKAQGPSTARDFGFATNRASLGMTGWGGD
jgi:hypothetical protein